MLDITIDTTINAAIVKQRALIIELVGLAGSGKTTLMTALSARDTGIRVISDLEIRDPSHLPIFAGHVRFMLSHLHRRPHAERAVNWDEMKSLLYLETWPARLEPQTRHAGKVILLNHGPIFKLATLQAFGPASLQDRDRASWWNTVFEQWTATLDLIVLLEAPEDILIQRINTRRQQHAVKGRSEAEASTFLARYQQGYDWAVAKLSAYGGPALLRYDTGQLPVEQIRDDLLAKLSAIRHARTSVAF